MPDNTNEAVVVTTVRLAPALRRQVEEAARASFRPLSSEIAFRLKRSFETPPEAAAS